MEPLSDLGLLSAQSGRNGADRLALRVGIVDDHLLVVELLQRRLARAGMQVVGMALTGADAIELAVTRQPDVLLLDIGLPDVSGLEVARRIYTACPRVAILLVTGSAHPSIRHLIGQPGIAGYVHKTASVEDLLSAVRLVAQGRIAVVTGTIPTPGALEPEALTGRERDVLELLAAGEHTVDIAAKLHMATRTVERHLMHLRTKLHARSPADLVRRAEQHGLLAPSATFP